MGWKQAVDIKITVRLLNTSRRGHFTHNYSTICFLQHSLANVIIISGLHPFSETLDSTRSLLNSNVLMYSVEGFLAVNLPTQSY